MIIGAGDVVRMTASYKRRVRAAVRSGITRLIEDWSSRGRSRRTRFGRRRTRRQWPTHIEEFGECSGEVLGPSEVGGGSVDVRWVPSGLRYCYDPGDLEIVEDVQL